MSRHSRFLSRMIYRVHTGKSSQDSYMNDSYCDAAKLGCARRTYQCVYSYMPACLFVKPAYRVSAGFSQPRSPAISMQPTD